MEARQILIFLSYKYKGNWEQIYQALLSKDESLFDEFCNYEFLETKYKAITILDDDYPSYLTQIHKPPFVLFYYGDISLIKNIDNNLAVVGTRKCTKYGINSTGEIVKNLSSRFVIVSGGARGIDTVAHESALQSKKKTICVLGNGIDFVFPKENILLFEKIKKEGLLISEYPFSECPSTLSFPNRNRLIAAFSKSVLIGEAPYASGSHITANFALEGGKNILCIPYRRDDENGKLCNLLIQLGAYLVNDAKDVEFFYK